MSSAQALVPKNMNTNLCNNTYLFSPPTAAALEQYTSFQILYHCIIVSLYHCIFAPSFITNIVISYFSFDKLFLIWQYQEYFTLTCKNTFRGQSRKQACLWLPLDGFLWNSTKCQQHNCELSWNISIYLSIYLAANPCIHLALQPCLHWAAGACKQPCCHQRSRWERVSPGHRIHQQGWFWGAAPGAFSGGGEHQGHGQEHQQKQSKIVLDLYCSWNHY